MRLGLVTMDPIACLKDSNCLKDRRFVSKIDGLSQRQTMVPASADI